MLLMEVMKGWATGEMAKHALMVVPSIIALHQERIPQEPERLESPLIREMGFLFGFGIERFDGGFVSVLLRIIGCLILGLQRFKMGFEGFKDSRWFFGFYIASVLSLLAMGFFVCAAE